MRKVFIILCLVALGAQGQELYVNTEPASNMAAKSVGIRLANKTYFHTDHFVNRLIPEIMYGINKNWMVHIEGSFSNYYTETFKPESANLYAKYRFFTVDGVQTHFRLACYGRISYSNNKRFDDLSLEGDASGFSFGLIGTQLLHKLALSGTIGYVSTVNKEIKFLQGEAYNYSLSAGYLLFPLNYTSYDQLNVNLYLELLGKTNPSIFDNEEQIIKGGSSLSLAPAVQFIIDSQTRIDIGYKTDLSNTGVEMGNILLFRVEYNIFNAW